MSQVTDTKVVIGGKVLTLSGFESAEYQQRIATYINDMIAEYEKLDGYRLSAPDIRAILLEVNIADDYFKAKRQIDIYEAQAKEKDREIYELKHDLVSTQVKLDTANKQIEELQEKAAQAQTKIVQLEAQLKGTK